MQRCLRCSGEPFYYRKYSGEMLCRGCFVDSILEKTRRTISKYKMLKYGDKIGVAVSGGKDSLSLLHILANITKGHASEIVALIVDEGIEGYREEAVKHAVDEAKQLGVKYHILSFKEAYHITLDEAIKQRQDSDLASCTICGTLRRRALDLLAKDAGVDVLATAHNLDDVLQTFIMNLLSGSTERIVRSKLSEDSPPIFLVRRIKPLMEIPEDEVALFAYLRGIPFQRATCPYMNESIRSEVRSILNEMELKHPGIKFNLLRSYLTISSNLKTEAKNSICSICSAPSSNKVCAVCTILTRIKHEESANKIAK
ncbi:MAG: TIGR00269 family protein [Nitrososphaerales archaeon]